MHECMMIFKRQNIYIKPDKHLLSTIKHNKATSFRAHCQYHLLKHYLLFCTLIEKVFDLQSTQTLTSLCAIQCKNVFMS